MSMLRIPEVLDNYDTYVIEYFPGTYGDFISSLITYSIGDFYYPEKELNEYITVNKAVLYNKSFFLQLRGAGYDFVENFTEFMLAQTVFSQQPEILNNPDNYGKKLLFNTHNRLAPKLYGKEHIRTYYNQFDKTQIKYLMLDMSFDSIFLSACNEYYTCVSHKPSETEWDMLFACFYLRVQNMKFVSDLLPSEKLLNVNDINNLDIDCFSYYGSINEQRFDEYYNTYKDNKLNFLNRLVYKRLSEIKEHDTLYNKFKTAYETPLDKFNFID